jgi:hypothetical protein
MKVVSESAAVVREKPEDRSRIEDILRYGMPVIVDERAGEWVRVGRGWMRESSLMEVGKDPNQAAALVSHRGAYLFEEADTERGPIFSLPFEAPVEVVEEGERWIRVQLFDGKRGYIQRSHLNLSPRILSLAETIDFSRHFLGLNYVYGGTTSYGYDCSGFVQMLYRQMGIALPRNSWEQAADVRLIGVEKAEAGDLVFFRNALGKVTHVAMMISSEEFIHAYTKEEAWICTGKLSDPKWRNGEVYGGVWVARFSSLLGADILEGSAQIC